MAFGSSKNATEIGNYRKNQGIIIKHEFVNEAYNDCMGLFILRFYNIFGILHSKSCWYEIFWALNLSYYFQRGNVSNGVL